MTAETVRRLQLILLTVLSCITSSVNSSADSRSNHERPHIIMIIADDMGWNDVGFHGADDVATPNIDALAYSGVILNHHYTLPLCTPSRAALLTGKYPIRTGMQHLVILEDEPWGLGLDEKLLPEYLKEVGYRTHAIGKWHLGFYRKEYTPIYRGFDTHFGYWQGYQDYYNHSVKPEKIDMDGYDMHRGMEPAWDARGKYSTDLFTDEAVKLIREHREDDGPMFLYLSHLAPHTGTYKDPMQAPYETVAKFNHIEDLERRFYAAMVSKLDDSVGEVVAALQASSMLDNSVIIFMSDNGGPTFGDHSNRASNYPLRGMKAYPWEGACRGVAAVWSPLLQTTHRVSNQMMHLVDWLPTLASLAGIDDDSLTDIDGLNLWPHLSQDELSPRTEFLYNIDTINYPYAAVRKDKWKYVNGSPDSDFTGWYGATGRDQAVTYSLENVLESKVASTISGYYARQAILDNIAKGKNKKQSLTEDDLSAKRLTAETVLDLRRQTQVHCLTSLDLPWTHWELCDPLKKPCLFDLDWDPCENYNVADEYPDITESMVSLLHQYDQMKVEARNMPGEASSNPALWNYVYTCWHDELDKAAWSSKVLRSVLLVLVGCVAALVCITPFLVRTFRHKSEEAKERIRVESTEERDSSSSSLTGQIYVRNER